MTQPGQNSLSSRFRMKRDVRLRALIAAIAAQRGAIEILDLGGSVTYWKRVGLDFLRGQGARVTVLNHVAAELRATGQDDPIFQTAVGDACDLSGLADQSFDLVHSNSVIEHVGNWARMKAFAAETRRVGRNYYMQTPYFWFPIDPHYHRSPLIHWLPRPWQALLLNTLPLDSHGAGRHAGLRRLRSWTRRSSWTCGRSGSPFPTPSLFGSACSASPSR